MRGLASAPMPLNGWPFERSLPRLVRSVNPNGSDVALAVAAWRTAAGRAPTSGGTGSLIQTPSSTIPADSPDNLRFVTLRMLQLQTIDGSVCSRVPGTALEDTSINQRRDGAVSSIPSEITPMTRLRGRVSQKFGVRFGGSATPLRMKLPALVSLLFFRPIRLSSAFIARSSSRDRGIGIIALDARRGRITTCDGHVFRQL